ncbi:hypothetical protein [Nocardia carnea]|uniref:hypothetical protein n=1 Tax=Nocardia carnea TaxID=37328 RepID=UPI002456A751|nr:hypothetical protein [Nocardia carnea]
MSEHRGVLRVGDRVVFGGLSHTVVAFTGATIRLLSDSGETTLVGLGYLLAAEDFELIGVGPVPRVES